MKGIFARITKIDEQTRTVTGRAVQEVIDRDGELFDYASSKPNFQAWSAEIYADTGGKSYGNVRSMHGNTAAGKLIDIEFNDDERAIDVTAKIVDDTEWEKCLEGVHSGFSIGGRYAKKWSDIYGNRMVTRYTAVPTEISLVDRPCVPSAKFFQIHKADGRVIRRKFMNKSNLQKDLIRGLNRMTKYMQDAGMITSSPSVDAMRKAQATGERWSYTHQAQEAARVDGVAKSVKQQPYEVRRTITNAFDDAGSLAAIQKARRNGLTATRPWGAMALSKAFDAQRGVSFPPQSSNALANPNVDSSHGQTNDWHDEQTASPTVTMFGGQRVGVPDRSNMDAAVDAIKRDLSKPKRMVVGSI
ncbi:MAG TPA: hypothetical protein VME42_11435 [Steroidobacteraceae bacterium]|nr:hypothetical protein [Steroidobacteraceae bacterium]